MRIHSFLTFHIIKKVKIFISGEYFNRRDIFSAFGEICQEGDPDFQHVFDFFQEVNYGTQSYSQRKCKTVHRTGPSAPERHLVQSFLSDFMRFHPTRSKNFPQMHTWPGRTSKSHCHCNIIYIRKRGSLATHLQTTYSTTTPQGKILKKHNLRTAPNNSLFPINRMTNFMGTWKWIFKSERYLFLKLFIRI